MNNDTFLENFRNLLEETDANLVQMNTKFKELEEWTSLTALLTIAMIDEEYNVKIKGEDIKNSNTIQDLFDIVKNRM